MNEAIKSMLARYECKSIEDQERALREIIQEIALLGLWRGKFFEHAAFYGGTALRILYGLDRLLTGNFITISNFRALLPESKNLKLRSSINR